MALNPIIGTIVVVAGNLMIGSPINVLPSIVVTISSYLEVVTNSLVATIIERKDSDN